MFILNLFTILTLQKEHMTIPCADGHGDYDDKFDGTGETEAIDVVFRCYTEESDGNYTAWVAISFIGGRNQSSWRKPPTCRK
jgi:hypothetical protein